MLQCLFLVIPAKAGTHRCPGTHISAQTRCADGWVPAFAGMTVFGEEALA
jgi:hypothetical protein